MGGRKLWLKEHTTYCFDKFIAEYPEEGQDEWYLPCGKNGMLALPRAQGGWVVI
jgi:hypothetical protein